MRFCLAVLIILLSLAGLPANAQGPPALSVVTNALVFLLALQPSGALHSGTGFFVDTTGVILTSAILVEEATSITALTDNGSFAAKVVEKDAFGFAVLQYDGPKGVRSTDLEVGVPLRAEDSIFIVGYARGLVRPAAPIVQPRKVEQVVSGRPIVFSPPVSSGFAGAPVADASGAVVGLVLLSSLSDTTTNLALSSPAATRRVLEAVQRALASPQVAPSRVVRPGDGIGPVSLQMTIEQANRAMGRPADEVSLTSDGNSTRYLWRLDGFSSPDFPPALFAFVPTNASRIVGIGVTARELKTRNGNGVGDSPSAFASEFGSFSRSGATVTGNTFWDFDSRGLRIFYRRLRDRDVVIQVDVYPARMEGQAPPAPPSPIAGLRSDLSIRPGVGISLVRLGIGLSEVTRLMGRTWDRTGPEVTGRPSTFYEWSLRDFAGSGSESPYLRIWVSNDRNTVHEVQTTAAEFRTPRGNGAGSPVDAFRAEFGTPTRVEDRGTLTFMAWDADGFGLWHSGGRAVVVAAWTARR